MASAQLKLYPIAHGTSNQAGERQKSLTPMSLPFWDDFSTPAHTDTLWEDKANVWINSGAAINPPTINVATFDGVNGVGVAYASNPNQSLDVGPTDVLISRKIKMTEVNVADQDSIFLSFYYQWGGAVEPPDANDKLELQFLDEDGNWDVRQTFQATAMQQPDLFYYYTIRINQGEYIHDDFQFRFQAYGRQSGKFDSWHIDYVYLNKGRTETDDSHPDRAITYPTTGIFDKYYSVPINHFFSMYTLTKPLFGVFNVKDSITTLNFDSFGTFKNYISSNLFSITKRLDSASAILDESVEFPGKARFDVPMKDFPPVTSDTTIYNPKSDSIHIDLQLIINSKDNVLLADNGDYVSARYAPIDFRSNDTIQFTYKISNYYAYDDGIAEYAVGLTQPGNVAAIRFVMQTPDPDTINGVYVHFPTSYGTFASTVTFYVWNNQNGRPGDLLLEESVSVQRSNNNEFELREFLQSAVVQDTFFIGWRKASTDRVLIGLDTSNDTGEHIYINNAGLLNPNTWIQNALIRGSLMIRPRFGPGEVQTSTENIQSRRTILYPNPNRGEFFIEGQVQHLQVLTTSGYEVGFEALPEENKTKIRLTHTLPGLYVVRYFDGSTYHAQKILIRE